MKIGYISCNEDFGLQDLLLSEGHELYLAVSDLFVYEKNDFTKCSDFAGFELVYPNTFHVVNSIAEFKNVDFIFIDYNDFQPNIWKILHEEGYPPVVGPSPTTRVLEEDRIFAKTLASLANMHSAPDSKHFSDPEQAKAYVQSLDAETKIVLKGSEHSVIVRALDAIQLLYDYTNPNSASQMIIDENAHKDVYIEHFVEGYEIAFGMLFDGQKFNETAIVTKEYKAANAGNSGWVMTGEVGTIIEFVDRRNIPVVVQQLYRYIEPALIASNYRGFIDINTIYNGKRYIFLEFTTRPGCPTELEIAGYAQYTEIGYGKLLHSLATSNPMTIANGIGVCAALQAHGIGSTEFKYNFFPYVFGLEKVYKDLTILPHTLVYRNPDGKKVRRQTSMWDRALFLANYFPFSDKSAIFYAREQINNSMRHIDCWGHTFRNDIGHDYIGYSFDAVDLPIEHEIHIVNKRCLDPVHFERLELIDHCCFDSELSWSAEDFEEFYSNPHNEIQISELRLEADNPATVVGYALFKDNDGKWYLENIAILHAMRRKGLGKKLLDSFDVKDCKELYAETHTTEAKMFHLTMGFVETNQNFNSDESGTSHLKKVL